MAKKKKIAKAKAKKRVATRKTEIVVRVQSQPMLPTPSETDLAQPIRGDGKELTIPKTWLSEKQITRLVERTPAKYVYKRPGKGGKQFDYVTVSYIQRVLDYTFGWNWDFEIVEHGKEADHVWVLGKLTVRDPANKYTIVKTQFGRSEVKYKKDSKDYVDYGNDLKAAGSDALKKCASMLGIARDIYGKTDYQQEANRTPRNDAPQETYTHGENVIQIGPPKEEATPEVEYLCHGAHKSGCGNQITKQEHDYSLQVYGKPLCRSCQKESTPLKKK